jgi:hydrogenase maturation protein HypF
VEHLCRVLEIEPEALACDRHPDYFSSRLARAYADRHGLPVVEVQHHHAHIGAIAAEHRLEGPLLGLALDGVGLGEDGAPWGGELLLVDGARCERLGHLAPLPLPGGDRAAREPWRMAAAALFALGRGEEIARRFAQPAAAGLARVLERRLNCPETSSAGRLFDAAAGLLGVKLVARFEGQAPMLLEGLAERHGAVAPLAHGFCTGECAQLSFLPLLAALAGCKDAEYGAALFHATFAAGLARWAGQAARRRGLARIALGGGCFLNHILTGALRHELEAAGLAVFTARQAPPNDGGIALGQAWVARERMKYRQGVSACA